MSERIEERLRRSAQTYRKLGNHTAEVMFLEAADTIWQLRDDLQRTNDAVQDAEHDESMAWDRVRKAEAENAKLREQVDAARMSRLLTENENESLLELVRELYEIAQPEAPSMFEAEFAGRMRELGVEL